MSYMGYIKVKSMKKKDFDKVKAYCDKCANEALMDATTPEELFNMLQCYKHKTTLEQVKNSIEHRKGKARYYKEHIDNDRDLVKYYTLTRDIDGDIYVNYESVLDCYIRVNDYPEGIFKSAKEVISLCEKNNWESAYWFDDKSGKIVRAQSNINKAKDRIKKMFKDNPNIVVEFG